MLVLAGVLLASIGLVKALFALTGWPSPLWPVPGLALAGLYLLGVSRWPAVFGASLLAHLILQVSFPDSWTHTSFPQEPEPAPPGMGALLLFPQALILAASQTLEAVLGVWLLRRLRFVPSLAHIRDVLVLSAVTLVCSLLGVLGPVGAWLLGGGAASGSGAVAGRSGAASLVGSLVVAPVAILLAQRRQASRRREARVLGVLVVCTSLLSFMGERGDPFLYVRVFLLFPLGAWTSVRFGPRGLSLTSLWLAGVCSWCTLEGLGPFGAERVQPVELQFFLAVISFSGNLLSVALAEGTAVHAQLKLLATAVSEVHEGVVICEMQEKAGQREPIVMFANKSFLEMGGWKKADIEGHSPLELYAKGPLAESSARLSDAVSAGKSFRGEVVMVRPDGSPLATELQLSPAKDAEGRVAYLVYTHRDITSQKELQAKLVAAERIAAVGTLAAGVGHEINNPLAYLMLNVEGVARSLKKGPEDLAEARARLDCVRESAERIRLIARDLKVFSRQEEEERAMLDVNDVVVPALRMAAHQVKARARLVEDLGSAPQVLGSESRLGQVVLNLLVNALQSIPEGQPERHEVRVRTGTDGAGRALVEVSDTGCGMTEAVRARIFEPFFTTKSSGVGTGLGLAICQQIIQAHGGELRVRSVQGQGSSFTVLLPAATPCQDEAPAESEALAVSQAPRRRRILVIDDEPRLAQSMRMLIEPTHEVAVTTRGAEALEWVKAGQRFDLVLCDLQMPETSGMDIYKQLRMHAPELIDRLVFISGGAYTQVMRDFVRSVHNRVLDKPVRPDELLATIDDALATQSAA